MHRMPKEDETMRRAIWIYSCEECMTRQQVGFCPELKRKPLPDSTTGFDPLCPLDIVRGHFK
ncbi:MAG TPA: hypothetical protein PKK85_09035 [Methanobacteriaceae archaeon]|nr:hypothetical protein [Methanobacteriaceae archaeon]